MIMFGSSFTTSQTKSSASKSAEQFELRPYQRHCVEAVLNDFASGVRKVGVILPTGAGKTEIMLSVADKYIGIGCGKALILSHMGLLVGQTSDRAAMRIPGRKIGWLKAGYVPRQIDDIIVGTMQSARVEDKIQHIRGIDLIIIDEAHFITSDSYKSIIERYPQAKIMGLTATPYKARRLMTNHFEKVSYCASLQEMIEQGYLLPPRLIGVEQRSEDVTTDLCALYKERELGRKAICFMPSVEEAELMASVFKMEGVNAATIVGSTPEVTRKRYIESFQQGDIDVLCTCDVLTAGFDAPCTEVIINGSRCGSPTTFMQRVGRGLRKYGAKTECRVYFLGGKVPHLEKKFYEDLAKFAIQKKPKKMDIFEALEWAKYEDDEQAIVYNKKMADIHNDIKKMGHETFAELIRQDALPRELLGRIDTLHNRLKNVKAKINPNPASEKQIKYLQSLCGTRITEITMGEANSLISVMASEKQPEHPIYGKQWNCPDNSLHKGKHIRDVPFKYIRVCLQKNPSGTIAKLFHKWSEFKKEKGIK
jgi:superfamily II DNA or RNA helicase